MIRYEIKKVFSKMGSKVGFAVLALSLFIACYFAVTSVSYTDGEGNTHIGITAVRNLREVKDEWKGVVTKEYLQEVIRENNRINEVYPYTPEDIVTSDIGYSKGQGFSDIKDMINQAFSEFHEYSYWRIDSVTEEEVGRLYENRIQELKNWLACDEAKEQFSEKEKNFLIDRYESLETPFYYEYADGWRAALEYAPTVIMLTVLILSFFVSGIFSNEFQWKADAVFFSAKCGRDKGTFSKIAAGLIIITELYWTVVGLYSVIVLGFLGMGGRQCAIQTGFGFWKSIYHINFGQAYILTIVGGYVGTLFILLLSMLVSAKTHTTVLSVTIPFIIIFIRSFLGGFDSIADVLGLLPDQLLQINMAIKTFTIYEIGEHTVGSIPILLTIYPVLCVIVLPMMYRIYSRTEIK